MTHMKKTGPASCVGVCVDGVGSVDVCVDGVGSVDVCVDGVGSVDVCVDGVGSVGVCVDGVGSSQGGYLSALSLGALMRGPALGNGC